MRLTECWIEDGRVFVDTGGDGEYNHEGYALQHARRLLFDVLGIDNDDTLDIGEVIVDFLDEEADDGGAEDGSPWYRLQRYMQAHEPWDVHLIDPAFDRAGDIREYAMREWGWKWVRETRIATHTLTADDLKDISEGLSDLGEDRDDPEIEEVEIVVFSTGAYHWIPLRDLLTGNWESLQLTSPAAEALFSDQVRRADAALMPACYGGKFGD